MVELKKIQQLPVDTLRPYHNHPFKTYTGKRLNDLAESIKSNGVLSPIIVRTIGKNEYEILSGHNRVVAAKEVGVDAVPAIIRDDLSEEEAEFIVTETNLLQRSFADLSHCERAKALAAHCEAIKHQGKRTDLLHQLEEFIDGDEKNTSRPTGEKSHSDEKTASRYGLSARNVSRYVRLSKLIYPLQNRLDNGQIPFQAGVEIAYICPEYQKLIENTLVGGEYEIDMAKAKILRKKLEDTPCDVREIELILSGEAVPTPVKVEAIRLGNKLLNKYFKSYTPPEEVERVIENALELWFQKNKD